MAIAIEFDWTHKSTKFLMESIVKHFGEEGFSLEGNQIYMTYDGYDLQGFESKSDIENSSINVYEWFKADLNFGQIMNISWTKLLPKGWVIWRNHEKEFYLHKGRNKLYNPESGNTFTYSRGVNRDKGFHPASIEAIESSFCRVILKERYKNSDRIRCLLDKRAYQIRPLTKVKYNNTLDRVIINDKAIIYYRLKWAPAVTKFSIKII